MASRVNLRDVLTLYRTEIRMALRERIIVVNSVLVPLFLYPLLMWLAFTGITFVAGQTEGAVSRLVLVDLPAAHPQLRSLFAADARYRLLPGVDARGAAEGIRAGEIDALVTFLPPDAAGAALPGNFRVVVTIDRSKERSAAAWDRVTTTIRRYREGWLEREVGARGVSATAWAVFTTGTRDVATGRQIGQRILSMMLPLFFVIMVAVGCFYPAIDTTAGERERQTWETLMSAPPTRVSIVVAKYLTVTTFGFVAGLVNILAMLLTIRPILAPILARAGEQLEFVVSVWAVPIAIVGATLLAGFAAAGMMLFAVFARTFKEGQAMITPFYILLFVPIIFLQDPDVALTNARAAVPVMNVALLIREAILGTFHPIPMIVTVLASTAAIAACLRLAAVILRFEDVMIGSYSGSFQSFVSTRLLKRGRPSRAREGA